MATQYTVKQVASIVESNESMEEVIEVYRRFPLLVSRLSKAIAVAPKETFGIIEMIPDYITPMKLNNTLKKAAASDGDSEDAAEDVAEPVEEKVDYTVLKAGQLRSILEERGLMDKFKASMGKVNRDNMVAFLTAVDNGEDPAPKAEPAAEPEAADEEEHEAGKYDGITAVKLFNMCKERGIKAKPKKPAKFYVELLEADDAAKASVDDGDDDWDDEPVSEEKPAPKAVEDDDDDDWDI